MVAGRPLRILNAAIVWDSKGTHVSVRVAHASLKGQPISEVDLAPAEAALLAKQLTGALTVILEKQAKPLPEPVAGVTTVETGEQ